MPHYALRPVAADQPVGSGDFFLPIGVAQYHLHACFLLDQAEQFRASFDGAAQGEDVLREQRFGLCLRDHQREGIGRASEPAGKVEVDQQLAVTPDMK